LSTAYTTTLVCKEPHPPGAALCLTERYAFKSARNNRRYLVQVDYYQGDVCAIKFYPKCIQDSKDKYRIITNYGDFRALIFTIISIAKSILDKNKTMSFAFYGERTIERDKDNKIEIEPLENTQRFKAYSRLVGSYVGDITFIHKRYPSVSCYLLINTMNDDCLSKELEYKKLFGSLYNDLVNFDVVEDENYYSSQGS
jgi:hypothetical protein